MVKNLLASAGDAEDPGSILGWARSLDMGMTIHSSILAWKIPWTEEPGVLQSMGSQRVGHDWTHAQTDTHRWRGSLSYLRFWESLRKTLMEISGWGKPWLEGTPPFCCILLKLKFCNSVWVARQLGGLKHDLIKICSEVSVWRGKLRGSYCNSEVSHPLTGPEQKTQELQAANPQPAHQCLLVAAGEGWGQELFSPSLSLSLLSLSLSLSRTSQRSRNTRSQSGVPQPARWGKCFKGRSTLQSEMAALASPPATLNLQLLVTS